MIELVRPPNRRDGHATLARLTESARKMLESRPFDKLKLTEVAAASDVTVGAFYARFKNKQALLEYLYQQAVEDIGTRLDQLLAQAELEKIDFKALAWLLFNGIAEIYARHFGVLRAMSIYSQQHPHLAAQKREGNKILFERGIKTLARFVADIPHPEPEQALRMGLTFVIATLRETFVLREFTPLKQREKKLLTRELHLAFLRYLGFKED